MYKLINAKTDPKDISKHEWFLYVKYEPNWFLRLLGYKEEVLTFIGNSTVWYSYPDFIRQDTMMESMLCNFYEKVIFLDSRKLLQQYFDHV